MSGAAEKADLSLYDPILSTEFPVSIVRNEYFHVSPRRVSGQ
jgi:hypothetical protein